MEDFQAKAIPHFNNIYHAALKLTKNQSEDEDLTEQVYRQAWTAFCFYKPEIDCRSWLLRILFRQFNRYHQKSIASEFVENVDKKLRISDFLEVESNEKSFV
jgi:DNA-directed RNA polymerase specialized sigma24 family protein